MKFLDNIRGSIKTNKYRTERSVDQVHSRPISLGTNPSWYQVVRGSLKVPQNSVVSFDSSTDEVTSWKIIYGFKGVKRYSFIQNRSTWSLRLR